MSLNIDIGGFSSKLVDNVGVTTPLTGGFPEKLRFRGTDFSTSEDDDRLLVAVLVASPRRPAPCISN